jgi:hypothetical protein
VEYNSDVTFLVYLQEWKGEESGERSENRRLVSVLTKCRESHLRFESKIEQDIVGNHCEITSHEEYREARFEISSSSDSPLMRMHQLCSIPTPSTQGASLRTSCLSNQSDCPHSSTSDIPQFRMYLWEFPSSTDPPINNATFFPIQKTNLTG